MWTKHRVEIREGVKSKLLEMIAQEQNAAMRNALARLIAEIARKELPNHSWPALLPWLYESATAPNALQRQTAMLVLFIVLETFVDTEALKH